MPDRNRPMNQRRELESELQSKVAKNRFETGAAARKAFKEAGLELGPYYVTEGMDVSF